MYEYEIEETAEGRGEGRPRLDAFAGMCERGRRGMERWEEWREKVTFFRVVDKLVDEVDMTGKVSGRGDTDR